MQTVARNSNVYGIANERKQARLEPKPIEQHHDRRKPARVGHIRLVVEPPSGGDRKHTHARCEATNNTKPGAVLPPNNQVGHTAILSRFGVAGIYMV